MLGLVRQVVGNIDEGGDRPLTIFTGIVDEFRLDHVLGSHSAYERVRELVRLAVGEVVDPQITWSGWAGVVVEQARVVVSEGRGSARDTVHASRQGKGVRLSGCDVVQVDVGVALYIRGESQELAVGRKALAGKFPIVLREPADFFARVVQQADVVVAVAGVGGDQNTFAVGRNVIGRVSAFAVMRRQKPTFRGRNLDGIVLPVS